MPTLSKVDDSKAAKKAALARAKQWRDERRGFLPAATKTSNTTEQPSNEPTPPTVTATKTNARTTRRSSTVPAPADVPAPTTEAPTPKRKPAVSNARTTRSSKKPAPSTEPATSEAPTPKRKAAAKDTSEQNRKPPSSETRAETRAKAAESRARAREWSNQQKKGKGIKVEAVPDLVDTDVAEDAETLSECADTFETANESTANAATTNIAPSNQWKREMSLLKSDMKNVLDRVQLISIENHELGFIQNDIRNISDRVQHMCDKYVDADESRAMDLD